MGKAWLTLVKTFPKINNMGNKRIGLLGKMKYSVSDLLSLGSLCCIKMMDAKSFWEKEYGFLNQMDFHSDLEFSGF